MPTDLDSERQEQKKWILRPQFRDLRVFDTLVNNEFLGPEGQETLQSGALRKTIDFAVAQVPYYRDLFARAGLSPGDIVKPGDLPRIPVLTRADVQDHAKRLQPAKLPPGEQIGLAKESSGSTGEPVRVAHTVASRRMFAILKQREYRWFGYDPKGTMAWIRTQTLGRPAALGPLGLDETVELDSWPAVGRHFETGPYSGFSAYNPVDKQADWLERMDPDYLLCVSAMLEHLALAFQCRSRPANLKGYVTISEELTPGMRARIENTFGPPVDRNYGLNEIGVAAARCPEGGRYHIHVENCLAEIVDGDGALCAPGEIGHLLVTSLTNMAMPLIRYDTGDMALTAEGPCPCGRTLPSFKRIVGRHKHMSLLPAGTLELAGRLRAGIEAMPSELTGPLRQYQVHHDREENFELRVVCESAMPSGFFARCKEIWRAAGTTGGRELNISVVDDIPRAANGKFFKFDSEFYNKE